MKRTFPRMIAVSALSAWLLSLTSCANLGNLPIINQIIPRTQDFVVEYEYLLVENSNPITETNPVKARMMLSGCELFFIPEEYGITAPLVAGDTLTVTYTGDMMIAESYPGQIFISGQLKEVAVTSIASLMECTVVKDPAEEQNLYYAQFTENYELQEAPPYYIDGNGNYQKCERLTGGDKTVYAAVAGASRKIYALYEYAPPRAICGTEGS